MSDLIYTNSQLANTPGKSERVEITAGLATVEAELSSIEADISSLDAELPLVTAEMAALNAQITAMRDATNNVLRISGKAAHASVSVASAGIFSSFASAGVPHLSIDAAINSLYSVRIKNDGAQSISYELRSRTHDGAALVAVLATGAVAAGATTTPALQGVAFDQYYEIWLRSVAGAGANPATINASVKSA